MLCKHIHIFNAFINVKFDRRNPKFSVGPCKRELFKRAFCPGKQNWTIIKWSESCTD